MAAEPRNAVGALEEVEEVCVFCAYCVALGLLPQRELGVALCEVEYKKPVVLLGLWVVGVDVFYLRLGCLYAQQRPPLRLLRVGGECVRVVVLDLDL